MLSQTWMPYDLLPSWVINLVHTDMRALIWAACHQVLSRQCHIMLQSLSAVAWSSLFCASCAANPPPPQKSMQLSNSWTHECKLQVLIYLCPRWFHPLVITLPTNHCSQETKANGMETSIVVQSSYYFCLVLVWWSTPSLGFCHPVTPSYSSVYFTHRRGTALGSFILYRFTPCWYMELLCFEALYLQSKHFHTVPSHYHVCHNVF